MLNREDKKVIFTEEEVENITIDGYIGNLMEFDDLTRSQIIGIELENEIYETDDIVYKIRRPLIRRRLHRIGFDIEDSYWPKVLDWSRSNLKKLFEVGYEAASSFVDNKDNQRLVTAKKRKVNSRG